MWEEFLSACEYCNFQQRKLFLECSVVQSLGNDFPTRVRLLIKLKPAVFRHVGSGLDRRYLWGRMLVLWWWLIPRILVPEAGPNIITLFQVRWFEMRRNCS